MDEQNLKSEKYLICQSEHLVLANQKKIAIQSGWQLRQPTYDEAKNHVDRGSLIGVIPHSIGLTVIDCDCPEDEAYVLSHFPNLYRYALIESNSLSKVGHWHKKHIWLATDYPFSNSKLPTPVGESGNKPGDIRGANGYVILYRDTAKRLREALTDPANESKLSKSGREAGSNVVRQIIGEVDPVELEIEDRKIGDDTRKAQAKVIFEEGSRNDTFYKEACKLYEKSAGKKRFLNLIDEALESGLTDDEIRASLISAKKTIESKVANTEGQKMGNLPTLLKELKKERGLVRNRKNKKSVASATADWVEKQFPGLEFVRMAGMDSDTTGFYPLYWKYIERGKNKDRGEWIRPRTNQLAQLIQVRYPEMQAKLIKETIYQLSIRERRMTHIEDWDNNPRYMGLADGLLWDFVNNTIVRQTKDIKISIRTPVLPTRLMEKCEIVETDVNNPQSLFEKCLIEWMTPAVPHKGVLEKKLRLLQMIMGYSLQSGNKFNLVFFHWGETGGNGKSVFMNAMRYALGVQAAAVISSDALMTGRSVHDTMLNQVVKARIGISEELEDIRRLNVPLLKKLSGNDEIVVRSLRQDARSEINQSTVHIPTNPHPNECSRWINDPSWRRRAVILPWEFTIPPKKMDPNLDHKLKKEANLILDWLLTGWMMYVKEGHTLDIPENMRLRENLVSGEIEQTPEERSLFVTLSELLQGRVKVFKYELDELLKVNTSNPKWGAPVRSVMERLGYTRKQLYMGSKRVWGYEISKHRRPTNTRDIFGR